MVDLAAITSHPRMASAEIRAMSPDAFAGAAKAIVNSEPLMKVFAPVEWDELHDGGKTWVCALIRETLAQAAAGNAHPFNIGKLTLARVFNASGLTNLSDMQAVLDAIERALAATDEIERNRARLESALRNIGAAGQAKYRDAVAILRAHQKASTSFLQRHLGVGYNEAARYIELMEIEGLVSKPDTNGARAWIGGAA